MGWQGALIFLRQLMLPTSSSTQPDRATSVSPISSTKYPLLIALLVASLLVWIKPLISTFQLALSNDGYTHTLLILPLSLALMFYEREPVSSKLAASKWLGYGLLLGAVLLRFMSGLHTIGLTEIGLSLSMLGLVLWWVGTVVVCFGSAVFRSLLFPLCLLILMVPLPERAVDTVREALQHQSAAATAFLFRTAGVPVAREDVYLSIPGLDIEVARECSSIRSSTMLVVTTLVLGHLFLVSWWRQVVLVVISFLLSVAKNAARIFVIAELGTRVDPGYLNGRLHRQGGFIFLGLAILVEIFFLWVLKRGEFRAQKSFPSTHCG